MSKEIVEEELLETLNEDSKWMAEHWDELRKYEGKVIAIKNRKVIYVSDSLEKLFKKLEEMNENPAFLLIETIPTKTVSLIL